MGKYSNRKYVKSWEEEAWAKGWLIENSKTSHHNTNDKNEAYCKYCHTSLRAHAGDLKRHATTPSHQKRAQNIKYSKKKENTLARYGIGTSGPSVKSQKAFDLQLAMYIASHASLRSIDHLSEILKRTGEEESCDILRKLQMHRTKCGLLIEKVIAPSFLHQIITEIGDNRYSLIIDESTDVSVNKYMAVCVRNFNETHFDIKTDFLGLIEIKRATAVDLYKSLKQFLERVNLPLKNLLAIGTDGASNLCGNKQSLFTLLKSDVPDLKLIKCTCHSLALCVSHASQKLPHELDFIAQEVYNWFSCSSLRRIEYRKIFDLINLGEDKTFKNFVQLSKTRWLARYEVIARILDHWLELKTFFSVVDEKCLKASMLKNALSSEKNRLFFILLKPILCETNQLNLRFQKDSCDIGSAYQVVFLSIQSLAKRIMKPIFLNLSYGPEKNLLIKIKANADNPLAFLPPRECDLGYDFNTTLSEIKLTVIEKNEILNNGCNFLKVLLCEMLKRLPSNIDTYDKIRMLNPFSCALATSPHSFSELPIIPFILPDENKSQIENHWRKLPEVSWKEQLKSEIPKNIVQLWCQLYKSESVCDEPFFKELATVILRMLSLPISNAVVERVFAIMNVVKTKIKNRMKLSMLEAIIRIRVFQCSRKNCCTNFDLTPQMFELFNSAVMYSSSNPDEDDDLNLAMELCEI